MEGYLGEEAVEDMAGTPFEGFGALEWIAYFTEAYGMIDGAHHKQWLIDVCARLARGAPAIVTRARWSNGHHEFRVSVGSSDSYERWVESWNGPDQYDWDKGIAP